MNNKEVNYIYRKFCALINTYNNRVLKKRILKEIGYEEDYYSKVIFSIHSCIFSINNLIF